jgi:hypothetical protein
LEADSQPDPGNPVVTARYPPQDAFAAALVLSGRQDEAVIALFLQGNIPPGRLAAKKTQPAFRSAGQASEVWKYCPIGR